MIRVVLPLPPPATSPASAKWSPCTCPSRSPSRQRWTSWKRVSPCCAAPSRDHGTHQRRPFIRYFACKEDLSLEPADTVLPDAVVAGTEPFLVVGAMAGG